MAFYEFINLPPEPNQDAAPTSFTDASNRKNSPSVFSELGRPDELEISVSVSAMPGKRGWTGSGPEFASCRITRRVQTHSNGVAKGLDNIDVGDLLLYRVARLSKDPAWCTSQDKADDWPKALVEMDVDAGVRLKYALERLVVDGWSMTYVTSSDDVFETLSFRAWVVEQSLPKGSPKKMALGNSSQD